MIQESYYIPINRWRNKGTEMVSDLFKITSVKSGGSDPMPKCSGFQSGILPIVACNLHHFKHVLESHHNTNWKVYRGDVDFKSLWWPANWCGHQVQWPANLMMLGARVNGLSPDLGFPDISSWPHGLNQAESLGWKWHSSQRLRSEWQGFKGSELVLKKTVSPDFLDRLNYSQLP